MTDRLNRFTPNAGGLDRDALLFAAGQQAARGSWVWKAIAGVLAATQVVTLWVLWPREGSVGAPGAPGATPQAAPAMKPLEPIPSPPPDMWTAHSPPDVVLEPPKSSSVEFAPAGPPMTAWSAHRFD
ncbi:MAG TPA: hypothetical protein VHR66_02075 [Gemmataceae bacterium]|jgi:hypothetical protein|nr:hypothetical protein [Gemmataceae bacterium]